MCKPAWKLYVLQFQWPPKRCHSGGSHMNKFEQVSSDHQMSLAGGFPGLMSMSGGPQVWCPGGWGFTLPDLSWGYPIMWCIWWYPPLEQIDTYENITFPQRYLRAVKSHFGNFYLYVNQIIHPFTMSKTFSGSLGPIWWLPKRIPIETGKYFESILSRAYISD